MLTCSKLQLWTDAKSREFIATEYPWFLATFDNYSQPIQRADAIRYFVLSHYGGIYIDLDDVRRSSSSISTFFMNCCCANLNMPQSAQDFVQILEMPVKDMFADVFPCCLGM